jgi:capsular exopolysaccharide synthesis family protein
MADREGTDLTISDLQRAAVGPAFAPDVLEGEFREVPPRRLRDHLRVLYKHRFLGAACFVCCVLAAALITWLTPRTYSASAQIQVVRSSPIKLQLKDNVLDLDETERILNGASSYLSTQVQALRSRDIAERAIRTFHLTQNPAFSESGDGDSSIAAMTAALPLFLRPRGVGDADAEEVAQPPAAHPATPPEDPVTPAVLDRYLGYLTVSDVRATDLIEVRFSAPDAQLAALLTAAHIQAYINSVKDSQLATDSTAKDFLTQQLDEARLKAQSAEAALSAFAAEHPEIAVNQEDQPIVKQIKQMSVQVSDAEARRAMAQSRVEFLSKAKRAPLQNVLDESAAIPRLRMMLLDVQAQEASLKQRLGPNHSQMRELRRQETELRLQIDSEIDKEIEAARERLNAAKMQEDGLRGRLSDLEKRATALRSVGGQYDYLKNERQNARALHESLLKQKTDTAVHSELAASNIRVIERPEVPRYASWPRKKTNLLIGALAGLGLAIGAAFFRESLDHSVKSSEEAEGLLQLPTLATIPNFALAAPLNRGRFLPFRPGQIKGRNGAVTKQGGLAEELVVARDPWSPIAETFRILRTALMFSSSGPPPQVIQVTSAASGEGKTVTALNLASTLAESGRRVLLIDGDLRHPGCHELLGVPLRPGLASYLDGSVDLARVVREIKSPRLSFISAGPRPANPADLIGSERMRAALDELRAHYDFIVLDSPPVLPVTDAVLLSRTADSVLLVLKGHAAPGDQVRRARDQLVLSGARVSGVVVNNVNRSWGNYPLYHSYPHYFGTRAADAAAPAVAAREA